jgi:DNA-binding MurR/RpiR family transcriptional regulator
LEPLSPVSLFGANYFLSAARRAAILTRQQTGRLVFALDLSAASSGWLETLNANSAALVLSGSVGKTAKAAAEVAASIRDRGCPLFAVTGTNHHDLIRQARLAVLLPEVSGLAGSILALATAGWAGGLLGRTRRSARGLLPPKN